MDRGKNDESVPGSLRLIPPYVEYQGSNIQTRYFMNTSELDYKSREPLGSGIGMDAASISNLRLYSLGR